MSDLPTNPAPITDKELIGYLDSLGLLEKLTEKEKETFLQISRAFNLNPFKREIYATKYGEQFSIIVGYEVYLKRAERTGLLDGWKCECTGTVEGGDLKATLTIWRKDRQHPFTWEGSYKESVQKTKEGVPNKFWRERPEFMTKKIVMAQGFRICFSDELGGMPYTKEEMDTIDTEYTEMPTTNGQLAPNYGELLETATNLKELETAWKRIPAADKPTYEAQKNGIKDRLQQSEKRQ